MMSQGSTRVWSVKQAVRKIKDNKIEKSYYFCQDRFLWQFSLKWNIIKLDILDKEELYCRFQIYFLKIIILGDNPDLIFYKKILVD